MQKLLEEVRQLSIEDLRTLNKFVIETVNSKKDVQSFQIGAKLRVNQEVTINSPKFVGKPFIVQKINKKNAILRLKGTFNDYNVAFSLINAE